MWIHDLSYYYNASLALAIKKEHHCWSMMWVIITMWVSHLAWKRIIIVDPQCELLALWCEAPPAIWNMIIVDLWCESRKQARPTRHCDILWYFHLHWSMLFWKSRQLDIVLVPISYAMIRVDSQAHQRVVFWSSIGATLMPLALSMNYEASMQGGMHLYKGYKKQGKKASPPRYGKSGTWTLSH